MTDSVPRVFSVFFVLFAVFFVAVLVFIVVAAVKRKRAVEAAGLDPFTADIQMATRMSQSQLFDAKQPLEQRLAELDDLRARGVITPQEHEEARRKALGLS